MRSGPPRRAVTTGVILFALSFYASQLVAADSGRAAALSAIHVSNFGTINDNYYRGGQPKGRDYADLAALGVKTVIDLTEGDVSNEGAHVKQAGMNFYRIPMTTHDRPSDAAVERFLALVNDKDNQPVFVHCQGGHHRTGVMTAVYRMFQDGWTADRAYGEMQKYGFGPAFLHGTLKSFVFDYYSAHAGRSRAEAAHAGQ
jgi:tyrosine-protein phosphatase SIW14